MTRHTIGEVMRRSDPIPDPDSVCSDREAKALFASISQRREAMVLQDERVEKQGSAGPLQPRFRRRFVIVAAALMVLVAVPAVAVFIDWDKPPLDQEFPAGTSRTIVYGADQGVAENCAAQIGFDPEGFPMLGGMCGVLRLDGDEFITVTDEVGSYVDMAVAPDGTVWLADVDGPVRSVAGGEVTEYSLVARQVEVASDGTVFAIRYGPRETDIPALMRYERGGFVEAAPGPIEDIAAARDGSLHTIGAMDFGTESGVTIPALGVLGRFFGGMYTTEPIPEGFVGDRLTVASDGALWVIGGTGAVIDRGGISDTEWALIRYDGTTVSMLVAPFPEPEDVAIHPDGTVWVTSSLYGAFAYDGEEWLRYGVEEGLPDEEARLVEIGPDDSVYIGTRLGLTRIMPEQR